MTPDLWVADTCEGSDMPPPSPPHVEPGNRVAQPPTADEWEVENAQTGGKKGQKIARFDLIPPRSLRKLAEHYGRGASKYGDRNWQQGYDWSLSFAAMQRHAWAFWGGEDNDPDSGQPHMAAVVFHAMALLEFAETCPELDDRVNEGHSRE